MMLAGGLVSVESEPMIGLIENDPYNSGLSWVNRAQRGQRRFASRFGQMGHIETHKDDSGESEEREGGKNTDRHGRRASYPAMLPDHDGGEDQQAGFDDRTL